MKKVLSILLALIMTFTVLPPGVFAVSADEGIAYSGIYLPEDSYYKYVERTKAATQADYSGAVTAISNAIAAVAASVDISAYGLPISQFDGLINNEIRQKPAFFYLNEVSCNYYTSTNTVFTVSFTYHYTPAVIQQMKATYETAITKALSWVKPGMIDAEKALAIHDYLILNAKYDYANYLNGTIPFTSYTAYGILALGVGVCEGYAMAFSDLMTRLGIPVVKLTSSAMNHAWNMVKLDGKWYHVDVTWDDPVSPAKNGWINDDYDLEGRVDHRYFLLSDSAISKLDHSGWMPTTHKATSTLYDGKYVNIKSGMFWDQGYWYYNNGGSLTRSLFNLSDSSVLKTVNGVDNNYSYVGVYSNRIYYNYTVGSKSTLRKMNFDGSEDTAVVTIDSTTDKITEFVIQDDVLKYTVYRRLPSGSATYSVRYHSVFLLGDVNFDGNTDGLDAGLIVDFENFFVEWDAIVDAAALKAADLNGDGMVDSIDAGILVDVENNLRTINQATGLAA